jgi:PKD repeat protein
MKNKILQTAAVIMLFATLSSTALANSDSMMPLPSDDYVLPFIYEYDEDETDIPPKAVLRVRNDSGNTDHYSGTTATKFTFDAYGSRDAESPGSLLEARFDFENDGKIDTYFTRTKLATHVYDTPGTKTVRVEVLDKAGNVSEAFAEIVVVKNTHPHAYFEIEPKIGTPGTEFLLDTGKSTDSQYKANLLKYRFDFNGDGIWDTKFTPIRLYKHKFKNPGLKNVIMEVRDPEGLSSLFREVVMVEPNQVPVADFEVNHIRNGRYEFDASKSFDPNGSKLKYRWDFDYTGYDDIQWNTTLFTSDKGFYTFKIPGKYLVRLMVQDEDKAKSYKVLKIIVDIAKAVW